VTAEPTEEPSPSRTSKDNVFKEITLSARTVRLVVLAVSVVLLLVLSAGVVVALLEVQKVRTELAEVREMLRTPQQVGGRPAAPPPPPLPAEPVSLAGAQFKGSRSARVAILEFSDFECPFCSRFTLTTFPELQKEYLDTGKVQLAFRHLPLDQIHPNARKAAEAAECAGKQGKFWEMHDAMFVDPKRLSQMDIQGYAAATGLRKVDFDRCLAGEATARVAEDVAEAMRLQVYGTPAFLVGTVESDGRLRVLERMSGAQQIGSFRTVLDRLLKIAN